MPSYAQRHVRQFRHPLRGHYRELFPSILIDQYGFNFRSDRAKELTVVLTQQDMPEQGMTTIPNLQYYCMTPYDDTFTDVHVIFPKDNLNNTLGED